MTIHAFSSFSFSYLDRARVLIQTLKAQHPDWVIWAVLVDEPPEGVTVDWPAEGVDHVLKADDLVPDGAEGWMFGMNIVEACTALKGPAAAHILETPGCTGLVYLDPDIAVFAPLDVVTDAFADHSIVLTPHQLDPQPREAEQAIRDNEFTSLTHGIYNLGFLALNNDPEGRRFARWWADRLLDWCHDAKDLGLFVDQKWCDLATCYFDRVKVLRDPGCNVASWNLSHRTLGFSPEGQFTVNGQPLRFFHFTKLGAVGDVMTNRYARENYEVHELWHWYRAAVAAAVEPGVPDRYWYFGTFDNGEKIPGPVRLLYRGRRDLQAAFPTPRQAGEGFYEWLNAHHPELLAS